MFLLILVSISVAALETHPLFRIEKSNITLLTHGNNITNRKLLLYYETDAHPAFFIIDGLCVFVFTVELLLRVISCKNKIVFFKSVYNIIDFLVVIPFFITFIINVIDDSFWLDKQFIIVFGYLGVSSVLRVFRLFKLARHYKSFRLMVLAVKSSIRELVLLFLLISMGMLIFSTLIYFAEFQIESSFTSIPIGFWWSIITMTTVGYGDYQPCGLWGYMVGGICAVSGTLITGLPIPIIASNFNRYYNNARFVKKITSRLEPITKWISLDQRMLLSYSKHTNSNRRNGLYIAAAARSEIQQNNNMDVYGNLERAATAPKILINNMTPLSSRRSSMESRRQRNQVIVPEVYVNCLDDDDICDSDSISVNQNTLRSYSYRTVRVQRANSVKTHTRTILSGGSACSNHSTLSNRSRTSVLSNGNVFNNSDTSSRILLPNTANNEGDC